MSNFMSGPDCGPVNPLQSLLKHSERDTSIQHDRFTPIPGPSGANGQAASMRTQAPGQAGPSQLDSEMRHFFAGRPGGATQSHRPFQDSFGMESLKQELPQGPGSSQWASQFGPSPGHSAPQAMQGPPQQQAESWRRAFLSSPAHLADPAAASPGLVAGNPQTAYGQMPYMQQSSFMPMYGSMGMQTGYVPPPMVQQSSRTQDAKGKGRFVELDDKAWEAQFAKLADQGNVQQSTADKESQTTAQAPLSQQTEDEATREEIQASEEETDADFLASLERTWKNLKDTLDTSSMTDNETAAWEAQYGTNFADLHGGDFESDWDEAIPGYDPAHFNEWLKTATEKPYPYAEENPYLETFDPFAEGQRLLREGAPLAEAALAFEAACRQNEHRGEAWKALGDTLAADEKELKAIKALERAVSCPDEGGEGAWMSLAVSYVNEGQDMRAFSTLEKWITTAYPGVVANTQRKTDVDVKRNPWAISEKITEYFLAAVRAGSGARKTAGTIYQVDPDVQTGLGVLFYTSSDYLRAKDCFEAALSVRPDDFLLWNRLGATLANGGQPEEAIGAYRKALELRPTFTRAIYNLGVSCLNINCYQEAAEHLLAALDLHRKDLLVGKGKGKQTDELIESDDGSDNLWHTLRRAFLCMDRPDLADRAKPGADVETFRKDGFDF